MILLVVDTQRGCFNEKLFAFETVKENIKRLIAEARKNNVEVCYVQHNDGSGTDLDKANANYEVFDEFMWPKRYAKAVSVDEAIEMMKNSAKTMISFSSMIEQIESPDTKHKIARKILEGLRDWFEVDESREKYISDCADWIFLAAKEKDEYVGFICLKETGKETVELAVMGIQKDFHRKGLGRKLFNSAKKIAIEKGYSFMQVKTVQMGVYPDYDITNHFYLSCGFKELEVFKEIWGEENPCQIYIMSLK